MNVHKRTAFSNLGPFWFVRRDESRFIKCLSSSRCFHFNPELDKREEQQVKTCQGSRSGRGRSGIDSSGLDLSLSRSALVGFESNNKYEVRNTVGQNVFYAVEENDCLNRQCCGPLRPFSIHILDNFGQEVITVTRPLKCMSCFFPCCLQEVSGTTLAQGFALLLLYLEDLNTNLPRPLPQLEVQAPPGNPVGYVIQQWHPFSPKFIVANEHNEPVLKIHGPFCGWSCLPEVDFEVGSTKHPHR